jgi:imidazole glycerol-phosphate synthase subunit HisF
LNIRIIPRLDIKGPNLVKGIHLEGLRVLGKPESFARYYYEGGADELVYMDVVASLYGRNSLHDIVERTSSEIFIPLCVGGGLRTVDDIRMVLRAGADKVSLNTAAINRPELITEAARRFGSSTILISIEAIRMPDGRYEAFTDNGRESTGVDAFEWAVRAVELGAGEIMVTSIDQEGTGKGFDLELVRRIAESVDVPVIASGGAGSPEDVLAAVDDGRAQAVALASVLHYGALDHGGAGADFSAEGNTTFLSGGRSMGRVHPVTIAEVKDHLIEHGIECRPVEEMASA